MDRKLKILILEDSKVDAEIIQRLLTKQEMHCECRLVLTRKNFLTGLEEYLPDVILSDNSLPGFSASDALKITRQRFLHTPFILVTGTVSEEYAASIIKKGADDYILKDRMERLPAAIIAALQHRKSEKEIADYKYALDQSAIVTITDKKGILKYANDYFCKISKFSREELICQDHNIVNSGKHAASYIKHLWGTIAQGKIWRNELCNKAKDGSFFWVDTTIVPFIDKDGKPYQYLSIQKDITEKKETEEELSRNELRFRTLTSNAPVGIFQTDVAGNTIYVNETWQKYTGLTFNEAMGDRWQNMLHPDDKKSQLKLWRHRSENGFKSASEYRIIDKEGNTKWVAGKAIPLFNVKQHIVGYIGTLSDITESKKAAEELRLSEISLNKAQALAHISSWEIDLRENVHKWSDEFYRIFGLTKGEVQPSIELFLSFIHADDLGFVQKKLLEAFETSSDSFLNFRFVRKDGKLRYGYTDWRFEFDKKRKPIRLIGILQDITDRTEAAENLRLLEQKILEQKIEEQKKIARAIIEGEEKEKNHIGRELHDNINQLLAGTKMFLNIAGNKNKKVKETVQYPIELIDSAINEIRLLCSRMVTPRKNVDLQELVRDLLSKLDQTGITKTVFLFTVTNKIIPDELKLNIYRIIQEHVNNILKYAEAKNVSISINGEAGTINVFVSDDGKGYDVEKKRRGIGISNIINRVATFNGEIKIESSPGNGCRTEISIPY